MFGKKKPKVNIVFVLDMTGSMMEVKRQAIDGYNEYVTGIQDEEPNAEITLTTFNSSEIKVYPTTPIGEAMLLNDTNYTPRSNTPLYDAIGQTILSTEQRVKEGDRVAFVILTDGLENASMLFTRAVIFAKLREKEAAGWGIIYLGANHDAYQEAMGMGINPSNVAGYSANNTGYALGTIALTSSLHYTRTGHTTGLTGNLDNDAQIGNPFRPQYRPKGEAHYRLITTTGRAIPEDRDEIVIGRSHPRDPSVPDIDLWALGLDEARTTSRRHCRIFTERDSFFIEDLGSMNGTYLNGDQCAIGDGYPLSNGDRIMVGRVQLIFVLGQ